MTASASKNMSFNLRITQMQNMKEYTIHGFKLKLYTPAPHSSQSEAGFVLNEGTPRIITLYENGRYVDAASELYATGLRMARQACGTTVKEEDGFSILQSTVGLSAAVPENCFALDREDRVVFNPITATGYDWDCDGDPITAIVFSEKIVVEGALINTGEKLGVFMKFPATKGMPVFKQVHLPEESFLPLTPEEVEESLSKEADPEKDQIYAAKKTMSNPPIGEVTRRWWSYILHEAYCTTKKYGSFLAAVKQATDKHAEAYREDLEGKGMKGARKGDGSFVMPDIFETPVHMAAGAFAAMYSTKGSINIVNEAQYTGLYKLMNLDTNQCEFSKDAEVWKPREEEHLGYTRKDVIGECDIVYWLMKAGYIKSKSLPNSGREGVPSAVSVTLWDPKHKEPVALTWVKDMGNSTAGYNFVLYPIFTYDPEVKKSRIMAPLEHMAFWLQRHFQCPDIYSVKYIEKMFEDGLDKARALEQAIRTYVNDYGDNVPSVRSGKEFIPNQFAVWACSKQVAIDFASLPQWNKNFDVELMVKRTQRLNELVGGLHMASTGSRRKCRKFYLAEADGLPDWVKRGNKISCQPHRPGRNASLLKRSVAKLKAKVAIVKTGSIQCFITPSGVTRSQPTEDIFLPDISPTEIEGYNEVIFYSWTGVPRHVWVSPTPKREAKKVGKFVCCNGSRFEPRATDQWWDKNTEEDIDIIMSYEELVEKELDTLFLERATHTVIKDYDGREVEAFVLDWNFFRSGAASENIKPRHLKQTTLTGYYGLLLASTLDAESLPFHRDNSDKMEEAIQYLKCSAAIRNSLEYEMGHADSYADQQ